MFSIGKIPVFKHRFAAKSRVTADGKEEDVLFTILRLPKIDMLRVTILFGSEPDPPEVLETRILVHPDRWDAFWTAINQPDVLAHPEVRTLLMQAKETP